MRNIKKYLKDSNSNDKWDEFVVLLAMEKQSNS